MNLLALIIAVVGLLMYALCANPKLTEIGRISFFAGLFAFLLTGAANILRTVVLAFAFFAFCLVPRSAHAGPAVVDQHTLQDFAQGVANAGNFSLAVSPGYAPALGQGEWGIAILGGYQVNDYLGAFIRADLFDKNYTVASGSMTVQVPIKLGKLTVRPFAEAGVGSALGGAGEKNKDPFAIAGGGVFVDIWQSKGTDGKPDGRLSFSAGYALETWQPVYSGIAIHRGFAALTTHF